MHTNASPGLASWLVEPGADIVLPMLLEVTIGNHIVMLHHVYLPCMYHNLISSTVNTVINK